MNAKLAASLVLAGLVVLVTLQNVATVEITFLFWSTSMPRALLMFLLLGAGIVIGWLLCGFLRHRAGRDPESGDDQGNDPV